MYNIHLLIGEHRFSVISETEKIIEYFSHSYSEDRGEHSKADLIITVYEGYGIPFVDYNVSIERSLDTITYTRADYLIKIDVLYQKATILVHNELALKHALMNLYSAFILHKNWGILLHSSCVLENGDAHIFSGQSGAGKSTAARLSYPRELLSDEATILKITPETVTVFDSPFRSELNGNRLTDSYQLKCIHLLHQSLTNQRLQLTKSTSLMQLIDKVFYWTNDSKETRKILQLLHLLVKKVPIYVLYFQKNNSFWELISNDQIHEKSGL